MNPPYLDMIVKYMHGGIDVEATVVLIHSDDCVTLMTADYGIQKNVLYFGWLLGGNHGWKFVNDGLLPIPRGISLETTRAPSEPDRAAPEGL